MVASLITLLEESKLSRVGSLLLSTAVTKTGEKLALSLVKSLNVLSERNDIAVCRLSLFLKVAHRLPLNILHENIRLLALALQKELNEPR